MANFPFSIHYFFILFISKIITNFAVNDLQPRCFVVNFFFLKVITYKDLLKQMNKPNYMKLLFHQSWQQRHQPNKRKRMNVAYTVIM